MQEHGSAQEHWERAYQRSADDALSWYQSDPVLSVQMIEATGLGSEARVLDVGGGTSRLVDCLLDAGYRAPGILDLSASALQRARARLGSRAASVEWFRADIRTFASPHTWDIWHDRAVFHFLTDPGDRAAYRDVLLRSLVPDGHLVMATFGLTGPERCSGLPTARYSCAMLQDELGGGFLLVESRQERHRTPGGKVQDFVYCRFRRVL